MTATVPVPIEFELPPGWHAGDVAGPTFVAGHLPSSTPSFTANITVGVGKRHDDTELVTIADESVVRLRQVAEVRLAHRTSFGTWQAPGVTQLLNLSTIHGGTPLDLLQQQVYLSMRDVHDPRRREVVEFVLTCTSEQFNLVAGDFGRFLRTVRPHEWISWSNWSVQGLLVEVVDSSGRQASSPVSSRVRQ